MSFISNAFKKVKKEVLRPFTPQPPPMPVIPKTAFDDPEKVKAEAEALALKEEKEKAKKRRGNQQTVLTSALGLTDEDLKTKSVALGGGRR